MSNVTPINAKVSVDGIAYRGHFINVNEALVFEVTGPAVEGKNPRFDSVREAKTMIDGYHETIAAEKKAEANNALNLEVVTDEGVRGVVRKINGNSGDVIIKSLVDGKTVDGTRWGFYPDVPWLFQTVVQIADLKKKLTELEKIIEGYRINSRRGYGRLKADSYAEAVESLRSEYNEKLDKALNEK